MERLLENWTREEYLGYARVRPQMYVGDLPTAHLNCIKEPLRLVWQARPFRQPVSAKITITPRQYRVACETGFLYRPIEDTLLRMLRLSKSKDDILEAMNATGHYLAAATVKRRMRWRACFGNALGPGFYPLSVHPFLTERIAVAVKTRSGYWCQTYMQGVPATTPFVLRIESTVGLLIAAAIDSEWFPGLPFTIEEVNQAIPESVQPFVTIQDMPDDRLWEDTATPIELCQRWLETA